MPGAYSRLATEDERNRAYQVIAAWAERLLAPDGPLIAVDGDAINHRWYLRIAGEDRDYIAIWLTVDQRSIRYEVYLMPAPAQRACETFEYLLRRNADLAGMHFAIGAEDAIYLVGSSPVASFDALELDRIIGTAFEQVERHFATAMSMGFAWRYRRARR